MLDPCPPFAPIHPAGPHSSLCVLSLRLHAHVRQGRELPAHHEKDGAQARSEVQSSYSTSTISIMKQQVLELFARGPRGDHVVGAVAVAGQRLEDTEVACVEVDLIGQQRIDADKNSIHACNQ